MELPLYSTDDRHDNDESERELAAADMVESLAWGSVAECCISVCCPLVMRGPVDATATALNLACPLLAGMAAALDEATGSSSVHQRVAAFQTGFVGVATSFSFMTEQASLLGPWWRGCAYIAVTIGGACASFAAGRYALGVALQAKRLRRALVAGRALPSSTRILRALGLIVALAWLWVLLAPAGAVFDPLAVRAPKESMEEAAAASHGMPRPSDASPPPTEGASEGASKAADVSHLACGLLMQALGLTLSARVSTRVAARSRTPSSPRRSGQLGEAATTIAYAPLLSNCLACAILVLLRAAEAAGLVDDDFDGGGPVLMADLFAAKVRTSFCGALSVSGMLGGFTVPHSEGHTRAATHENSETPLLQTREARAGRSAYRAVINLVLHAGLAAVAMLLLPRLQAWAAAGE